MEAWDLVHQAQQGSPNAFGELYSRYYDGVYHYVLARTGRPALAEDLSSETFLRALRRIGTVRYTGKDLNSWLITIARNVVIDHFKSGPNRREVLTEEWALDTASIDTASMDSAEQVALSRIHRRVVRRALRSLTPVQQHCLQLRFYQALSVAVTGQIMQLNPAAVRALQYRAIRRLAGILAAQPARARSGPGQESSTLVEQAVTTRHIRSFHPTDDVQLRQ